jgi:hypothetical protein
MSIATGWTNTISYFLSKGYGEQELYATSWGDTNEMEASLRLGNKKVFVKNRPSSALGRHLL